MSKFATKAAANMFCQARYEAAKSNERLSSREGAAEEIGIDRTRLARIELGSTIPYQEEVLLMADCYKAPELKGNYCREMCPLGKNMPKIENAGLDRISLRMLSSLKKINEAKESLLDITADGIISEEEKPELKKIIQTLDEVNEITQNLKNWVERNLENANGVIKKLTSAERSYYTAAEVREMMGVSRDTAYRMIRSLRSDLIADGQLAKGYPSGKIPKKAFNKLYMIE